MFRKRRNATAPGYGIPSPFNAIAGTHADLRAETINPYCAMMQVAADDDYEDYVVCRGFDPRIRKFINYPPGISVAKPFGNRRTNTYKIGQVFPAFLPTQGAEDYTPPSPIAVDWRVGQTSGTAPGGGEGGHPDSLSDAINELYDYNGTLVQWLLVDVGASTDGVGHHGTIDEDNVNSPTWCDVVLEFLDETVEAFYYDLGLGDELNSDDPVTLAWSTALPVDAIAPNAWNGEETKAGWMIVTWPCPEDVSAAPPAPNLTYSDFSNAYGNGFGGPTGGFNLDFGFGADSNYYNSNLLADLDSDSYIEGRWLLADDAATTTVDDVANGNDGTLYGGDNTADITTDGPNTKLTAALDFNGTDDYILLPGVAALGTNDLSLSFWVKTSETGINGLLVRGRLTSVAGRIAVYIASSQIKSIFQHSGGDVVCESGVAASGSWQHIVVTCDRDGDMTLYVDGVSKDVEDISAGDGYSMPAPFSEDWAIGQYYNSGGTPAYFTDGDFTNVLILHRLLTAAEIEALYREGV